MSKKIIHLDSDHAYHAGSKAMADCEKVLIAQGYELLNLKRYSGDTLLGKLKNEWNYKTLYSLGKKDILVMQHPYYIGTRYMQHLKIAKKIKKFKIMIIIHDLESLRGLMPEFRAMFWKLDDIMLNIADVIIAHNFQMIQYLIKKRNVEENKLINLEVFDYLVSSEKLSDKKQTHEKISSETDIALAGNFSPEKSGYVYELLEHVRNISFNIYGINFPEDKLHTDTIRYKGAYPPDELPGIIEGRFGLVWDGDSITTCAGNTGNYMKYNNPHKVSLYIAAGMPILIWKKAALAHYVTSKGIGIEIDNLNHLEQIIKSVTQEDYEKMKKNICELSEKIKSGKQIHEAVRKGESLLRG